MTPKEATLSRLEKVELREAWESEAGDFTPWLAKPENLALLGETIGMELALEQQEAKVGPFRADILCKDTNDDWVLIENQLERTDHCHLGQLMTYAAGLKAVTIIWIAERFTEEHRAALDWLNAITDDDFTFFGLEIELWRIGQSPIAPKFNIACKPNDWSKAVADATHGEITDTKLLQQEFWAGLSALLIERKSIVKPQKAMPQHWANFAIGRAHFCLTATVNTQKGAISACLTCHGNKSLPHFRLLEQEKAIIEQEIGCNLEWEELPGKKEKRIALRKNDIDPTDRKDWPNQHLWLAERLESLYKTFAARVKELNAEDYEAPDEE